MKTKSKNSSIVEPVIHKSLGDPDCPYCHGVGYLRADLPVGHPDFGKLQVCTCRHSKITDSVRERLFALSHLDELKDMTFETFDPRGRGLGEIQANSLAWAFDKAKTYARSLQGWLLLQGGFGRGKTHLAAAIANYAVSMGVPTAFLTVPDLLDALRFAYDSDNITFEQRFDEIRNTSLLILDDFGTQNATGWAQEKLFQIINYRYINKLSTVVTTNLPLEEIESRISSRLRDPSLVTTIFIQSSDFRRPTKDIGDPEISSLKLHTNRTFKNFSLRKEEGLPASVIKSLKDAYEAAQAFAKDPEGWLILTGDYASGKTHLAAAIAHERARLGDLPLFVTVPDLLDYLRATFSPNSQTTFDRRFDEVRTTHLLVLDDFGTQSMTPWAREKLYQLFNHRYNTELPTVITISADVLENLDARISSRLHDTSICEIIGITAPAYQGKGKKKAKR